MTRNTDRLIFISAAAVVRLTGFNTAAIWYDEAITNYRASLPWREQLIDLSDLTGFNIWEQILRPFAGGPLWLLRVPALIASLAALWLAYGFMDRIGLSRIQKNAAAVALALLPGLLWQAQDARYYAALGLLYVAALLMAYNHRWIGLAALGGLAVYIHPTGPVYALGAFAVAAIAHMPARRLSAAAAIAGGASLPRIIQIIIQQESFGTFWLDRVSPGWAVIQSGLAFTVGASNYITLIIPALLLVLFVWGLRYSHRRIWTISPDGMRALFVAAWLPVLALLLASLKYPVYFYRPLHPALIPLIILAAVALFPAPPIHLKNWIAPSLAAALLLLLTLAEYNPANRGGYTDHAAAAIAEAWQDGDKIIYVTATAYMPFNYYLPDYESCLLGVDGIDSNLSPRMVHPLPSCSLDELTEADRRLWLVWPHDQLLSTEIVATLDKLTARSVPVARTVGAFHFAPIEVFLLNPHNIPIGFYCDILRDTH